MSRRTDLHALAIGAAMALVLALLVVLILTTGRTQ